MSPCKSLERKSKLINDLNEITEECHIVLIVTIKNWNDVSRFVYYSKVIGLTRIAGLANFLFA